MGGTMYGNHPYGTKSKRDIHNGTKLRWAPRLSDGKSYPVTIVKKGRKP